MIKKILNLGKKFIVSTLLIYTYNKLALPLDVFIPINIITIFLVMLCGLPSIFVLFLFSTYMI